MWVGSPSVLDQEDETGLSRTVDVDGEHAGYANPEMAGGPGSSTGPLILGGSSESYLAAGSDHEAACLAGELVLCAPGADGRTDDEVDMPDDFCHGRFGLLRRPANITILCYVRERAPGAKEVLAGGHRAVGYAPVSTGPCHMRQACKGCRRVTGLSATE